MSGHSHAKKVMHQKGAADAKRSQLFSKLAKELTIAAKEGGGADPMTNPRLRTVMEKAKAANMPADNVERAIKRATGEDAGQLEEVLIEAYGPGGAALLISAITDNRNRTISEIKQILQRNQGKMVEGGAVRWLFERRGVVRIEPQEANPLSSEELELMAIEVGAEDFYWRDHALDLYCAPSSLASVMEELQKRGLGAEASLDWVPKEHVQAASNDTTASEQLFEALEAQEDVQNVYSNV